MGNKKKGMIKIPPDRFDSIQREVDGLLPHVVYKFVYETMPSETVEAIEKCFAGGVGPEKIADFIAEKYPEIRGPIKRFFIKALEHHKFLWDVKRQ